MEAVDIFIMGLIVGLAIATMGAVSVLMEQKPLKVKGWKPTEKRIKLTERGTE